MRHFQVVVEQRRLRNVLKSVTHVQSCCFARLNPLLFCRSRCRRRRRCLSSIVTMAETMSNENDNDNDSDSDNNGENDYYSERTFSFK